MVAQVGHRYPHANVLEIGAGQGETTGNVLNALGAAFSTYTYADASDESFEAAQERFREFSSRMIFRTYDTEQAPASQGFTEGYYDVVFASDLLNNSAQADEVIANARRLLKPGGYLITLERTSNDNLCAGLIMGSLPSWWTGTGPALCVSEWDDLLLKSGFSGIDTDTPRGHRLNPYTVFATQAVDERIDLLRYPLESGIPETPAPRLVILGGQTLAVRRVIRGLKGLLGRRFQQIEVVNAVESLNDSIMVPGSAVLSVTELDEPVFAAISPAKLEGLKALWRSAGTVLWVTRRARTEEPLSFMSHGLCRVVKYEYPNVSLQVLDLDVLDAKTSELVAEEFIRTEALRKWAREARDSDILWSAEPEVSIESGKRLIPRLYKFVEANDRYNTARRTLMKLVDPKETPVVLTSVGDGQSYDLRAPSPLRLPPPPPSSTSSATTSTVTVSVSHMLLQAIELPCNARVFLCAGTDEATGKAVLAITHTAESRPTVPAAWTVPLSNTDPEKAVAAVAARLVASTILNLAQPGSAVLVHEPDALVAAALAQQSAKDQIEVVTTTSSNTPPKGASGGTWHHVHSKLSTRTVKKLLPSHLSVFVDLSQAPHAAPAGRLIARCLPPMSASFTAADFYGTAARLPAWLSAETVAKTLVDAQRDLRSGGLGMVDVTPSVLSLQDLPSTSVFGSPLTVARWSAGPVSVRVEAIDEGPIFRADRTYWLVGMAGNMGQGICKWMIEHGAKYVVLSSRRPKPLNPGFLGFVKSMGARVEVLPLDVTSKEAVFECHRQMVEMLPPVGGVAMGAMVLEDSLFERLSFEVLTKVLEPKVAGTRNLDALFYNTPLDFFVVFSSLVCVTGNSGQSNYVAANMYMTAVALHRKRRGLAGSAIALGSVMGVGFVERTEALTSEYFIKLGTKNVSEQDVQQQFAEAIRVGRPDCDEVADIAAGLVPIYADTDAKAQFRDDVKFGHFIMQRAGAGDKSGRPRVTLPVRVQLPEVKSQAEAMEVIKGQWPPLVLLVITYANAAFTSSIFHLPPQAHPDDRTG
jgi:hybrid polyketide synthase/nonribosomal peptide synthetase ACE1